MTQKKLTYAERSKMLLDAIIVGEGIISNSKQMATDHKELHMKFLNDLKNIVIYPEEKNQNLKSLSYLEDSFLTFWNESFGEDVELFWKKLSDKSIPYERKDIIKEVLKNKKIKTDQEYNAIKDGLVIAQQTGKITTDEAANLSKYISNYENKGH